MPHDTTIVFGVPIPSVDPVFLAIVRFHIGLGIIVVVAGAIAMLSYKGRGRHSTAGTVYYWSLAILVATATALSAMRSAENYHLFLLGTCPWWQQRWAGKHYANVGPTGSGFTSVAWARRTF